MTKPPILDGARQRLAELATSSDPDLLEFATRFSQLANHVNQVVWMTDPAKQQMLIVSRGYERIWGRSRDSLDKQPFRAGSTHVVLEPLDFIFRMNGMPRAQGRAGAAIARLAALVPRPRLNLTRFHGVFTSNFKHRQRIVPRRSGRINADRPPAPMSWMQRLKRVFAMPQGTLS